MITNDTDSFLGIIEESVKHVQDAESHMAFLMRGGTAKGLFGALKYAIEKRLYTLTPAEKKRAEDLFDAFTFTCGFWTGPAAKPMTKAAKNPFRDEKAGQTSYGSMMDQLLNQRYRMFGEPPDQDEE